MRAVIGAGFVLLLASAPAVAGPSECAAITADAERLACFDRVFPRPVQAPAGSAGHWRQRTAASSDPGQAGPTVFVDSAERVSCRLTRPRPVRLIIACLGNVTSVAFETGCFMTSSRYRNYGDVTYRIDGGSPKVAAMAAGNDDRSLGFWSGDVAIPFVRDLLAKSRLTAKMTPFSEDPLQASFDIRGLEKAIAPVRKTCGW